MKSFLIIMKKTFRAKALTLKVFSNHGLKPVVTHGKEPYLCGFSNRGLKPVVTRSLLTEL